MDSRAELRAMTSEPRPFDPVVVHCATACSVRTQTPTLIGCELLKSRLTEVSEEKEYDWRTDRLSTGGGRHRAGNGGHPPNWPRFAPQTRHRPHPARASTYRAKPGTVTCAGVARHAPKRTIRQHRHPVPDSYRRPAAHGCGPRSAAALSSILRRRSPSPLISAPGTGAFASRRRPPSPRAGRGYRTGRGTSAARTPGPRPAATRMPD